MLIPGFFIAWLTFPGVIVHEAAHLLMCRLCGVPVFDVRFFSFDVQRSGYVAHATPPCFRSSFLIAVAPFLVNTLLCVLFCFPAFVPLILLGVFEPLSLLWTWLGVSIGMHAFPSPEDAQALLSASRAAVGRRNVLAILTYPLVLLIYLGHVGSALWLDVLYGILIGIVLPAVLLKAYA